MEDTQGRERGDAHALLDQRDDGAFYTGPTDTLLAEVRENRDVHIEQRKGRVLVEFRERGSEAVAEWGIADTEDDALRYALGAYVD